MEKTIFKPMSMVFNILIVTFSALATAQQQPSGKMEEKSPESVVQYDDTRHKEWSKDFELVKIPSTADGEVQKAYFHKTKSESLKPLIVSLHTWSGDYYQADNLAPIVAKGDFNYIHPHFRGPNNTVNACVSELALSDIDDAINYAIANSNVDTKRVYVIGVSGGGYATLASFMKLKYRVKGFMAWASITDLVAWYSESSIRKNKYAGDILSCTGSINGLNVERAKRKSPLFMDTPTDRLKNTSLSIYAGIYDGIQGSVPITHSINFYNKILKDLSVSDSTKYVSDSETLRLLENRSPLGDYGIIGGRKVCLKKQYGELSLTIFEGNHEMLPQFALKELLDE